MGKTIAGLLLVGSLIGGLFSGSALASVPQNSVHAPMAMAIWGSLGLVCVIGFFVGALLFARK